MSRPPKTPPPPVPPAESLDRQVERTVNARLVSSFVSPDLAALIQDAEPQHQEGGLKALAPGLVARPVRVIIEFNVEFPGGARQARELFFQMVDGQMRERPVDDVPYVILGDFALDPGGGERISFAKSRETERYAFATLLPGALSTLQGLMAHRRGETEDRALRLIYKIWRDPPLKAFVYDSRRTIKADAAAMAFGANGDGIVWAVMDTGIDAAHPHWRKHDTLTLPGGLRHRDFTGDYGPGEDDEASDAALTDTDGHGTHVSGIIAGECTVGGAIKGLSVIRKVRGEDGETVETETEGPRTISGVAPLCKLMSLKVLTTAEDGQTSDLIAALAYVRRINGGDEALSLKIHGVNLSLGYPFEAEWYAAGHTPLCAEVDRLVRSGVMVVVAAGNAGYGAVTTRSGVAAQAALPCTIADPGNAERALTVGSTHRNMPMTYGVSYFSAKGPTADGRQKPDLVAPGERIVSCAAGDSYPGKPGHPLYREESGTSMAAPHVSGAAAAFMSIRVEYQRDPEALKALFCDSATSLKRTESFQGKGLIDLMRAIQKV